jgi:hypothetical protein
MNDGLLTSVECRVLERFEDDDVNLRNGSKASKGASLGRKIRDDESWEEQAWEEEVTP